MNQDQYAAQRLRKRMWITLAVAVLALITVLLSVMSGAFNFHKGSAVLQDLTGMPEEEAVAAIEKLGGHASVSYEPSGQPEGTVLRQSVLAGDNVTPNSTVSIVVSGAQKTESEESGTPYLPSFIGLSMELAQTTAEQLGVHLVEDGYVYDDNIPYGSIVDQSPEGGAEIVAGSAVRVTLSQGPEFVRYTITVEAGPGGFVSPGTTTVDEGADVVFTITPNEGYVVDSLRVDGESIRGQESFSFLSVDADHVITVTFRESRGALEEFIDSIFGGP